MDWSVFAFWCCDFYALVSDTRREIPTFHETDERILQRLRREAREKNVAGEEESDEEYHCVFRLLIYMSQERREARGKDIIEEEVSEKEEHHDMKP